MNINTYGNSLRIEPIKVGSPIARFVEPSLVPVGIGNIFDGSTSKSLEMYWNNTNLLSGEKMRTLLSKKIKAFLFCYLYFATGLFIVLIGGKYLIRIFYGVYHLQHLIELNDIKIILFIPIIISYIVVFFYMKNNLDFYEK